MGSDCAAHPIRRRPAHPAIFAVRLVGTRIEPTAGDEPHLLRLIIYTQQAALPSPSRCRDVLPMTVSSVREGSLKSSLGSQQPLG